MKSQQTLLCLILFLIIQGSFSLQSKYNIPSLLCNRKIPINIIRSSTSETYLSSTTSASSSDIDTSSSITSTKLLSAEDSFELFSSTSNPIYKNLIEPVKYGLHIKIKNKIIINIWSLLYSISIVTIAAMVMPFMMISAIYADLTGNGKKRTALDWMIHIWARVSLQLCSCYKIRLYGKQHLPPFKEPVVYVPNHTSYFDILVLSGCVPRPFKYLSKAEILNIPLVGTGMRLAKHVFLKRNDLQSTIQCTEIVEKRLRDGNSVVLFAEGTRSPDGSLKSFKKGAFQMAKAAGVKIVPVSIGNLHRLLPENCPLPIAPIRYAYVKIHEPIDTKGKSVKEIKQACFDAVNSGLPLYQQAKKDVK